MIREIVKDTEVLKTVSSSVKPNDAKTKEVITDLIDTATSLGENCVGLAAIQIGEPYRIIVVFDGSKFVPYVNPVITNYVGVPYEVEEGCVSLEGTRIVKRYHVIHVIHRKGNKFVKEKFGGFFAQIFQHEVNHLDGKLI